MVGTMEIEGDRLCGTFPILALAQIARLHHLREHHVAALTGSLRIAHRIEERWVLAQTDEGGSLAERQVLRLLIKIGVGSRLDTHGIVQEVEVVEIQRQDFLLGIIAFQLDGYHPLYRFLQDSLQRARSLLRIELLGQLLGDGASTACIGLPQDASLDDGTPQGSIVDARVLIESLVLGSHQCLN